MTRPLLSVLALIAGTGLSAACAPTQDPPPTANLDIPGMQEREQIRSELIAKRLDTVLLDAMRNNDIDAWLTFSRGAQPRSHALGDRRGMGGVRNAYIFFDRGVTSPRRSLSARINSGTARSRTPTTS